jgi:hypothetical protein
MQAVPSCCSERRICDVNATTYKRRVIGAEPGSCKPYCRRALGSALDFGATVFSLTTSGVEQTLYIFAGADGTYPATIVSVRTCVA